MLGTVWTPRDTKGPNPRLDSRLLREPIAEDAAGTGSDYLSIETARQDRVLLAPSLRDEEGL